MNQFTSLPADPLASATAMAPEMTRLAPSRWLFHVSTGAIFLTDCLLSPLVPTPVLYAIPLGLIASASPRELRSVAWLGTGLGLVAHVMSLSEAAGAEMLLSRLLSLVPVWTMALCLGHISQSRLTFPDPAERAQQDMLRRLQGGQLDIPQARLRIARMVNALRANA